MHKIAKMPSPEELKEEMPLSEEAKQIKAARDKEIRDVFTGASDKFLVIIGPCSADNETAVMDYLGRLARVQKDLADKLLITSGMGKAGQIAMNIATTFCSTGTPAYFLHPSEAQHGDLGIVRKNDVMLLISNSGKTRELLELVELTRGLVPEMQFIVITGNPDSPLAAEATICLPTGAPKEVCPLGLTPTTSTTVMTVIGDLLVVGTMKRINFGYPDYAKRHHGGYLGSKSREQCKTENK